MNAYVKNIFLLLLMLVCSAPSQEQDLLTMQAPIDTKLKALDSLSLIRMVEKEKFSNPAAALYGNWGEHYSARTAVVPDSFVIDLTRFHMPTTSHIITSDYGVRRGRQHKGVDIKVYTGDTIRSVFSGKVRIVRYDEKGYGNYVVIRHHNGLETIYGHMSKNLVAQDAEVRAGTPIGLGGNSGRTADSHLHFETRFCGIALDPALLFDFRNQDVTGDTYLFCRNQTAGNNQQAKTETAAVRYHKVASGETLASIARKHSTTVDDLCHLNHIGKSARLRVGQILKYNQ